MLKNPTSFNNTLAGNLVQIWSERYVLDLSAIDSQDKQVTISELVKISSTEGRKQTVAHLKRLGQINCEAAGMKTDILFSYIPNVVNLTEAERLAKSAWQVYEKGLEVYEQQSPIFASLTTDSSQLVDSIYLSSTVLKQQPIPVLNQSAIEQLVIAIEPVIQQLRQQLLSAKDSRTLGFMSTQFHLSTELILKRLTRPEQILLKPYFEFIEEQVCIPLQQICAAAGNYYSGSPTLKMVEQLLSKSRDIANSVYQRAVKLYPNHRSLRGTLNTPGVMESSIRDIQMLQAYILLCVLEGSMVAVEQQLIPLSILVFPSVSVTWKLVEQGLQLLADEMMSHINPVQQKLLLPYTQAMQQLFSHIEKKAA
ncbi:MAG: hypothetical protein U7123_11700 [Potamolinea sp.]